MSVASFAGRAGRLLRKSPAHVLRRVAAEVRHELDRFTQPAFGARFGARQLLARTGTASVDELWHRLLSTPAWPIAPAPSPDALRMLAAGEEERILAAADAAARHEIDLLGSGPVALGPAIDWHRDFKTGDRWPPGYFRGIDYVNRGRPSDVKTVWELSRMQWLLPCGQAYALTGDERHAQAARDVIVSWIEGNPYAASVNWCVTMEPAMRIFALAWLLRTCGNSAAWADPAFRQRYLCTLFLHAVFTERFIERSDVNGNHFTADAAALVLAGALFGTGPDATRWLAGGMADLEAEMPRQVHRDGVDFEASSAYHRLVAELFLIAGMAAECAGVPASPGYRSALAAMARFTAAYMRPDHTAPCWGDHDDARTLPLGGQAVRDHRYLVALIGLFLRDESVLALASGGHPEVVWWFGADAARCLRRNPSATPPSEFPAGGVYVLRRGDSHVFVDCGPIGLSGRGGHGHNDLLSFEAVMGGVPVVTERGCHLYTADFPARQADRATAGHNTPSVAGQEINRFEGPEFLWSMHNDARHAVERWEDGPSGVEFVGSHDGYRRLSPPVIVRRSMHLDAAGTRLAWVDAIEGGAVHAVAVPLHLDPGVSVEAVVPGRVLLRSAAKLFAIDWAGEGWSLRIEAGVHSATYGRQQAIARLCWETNAAVEPLAVSLAVINAAGAGE